MADIDDVVMRGRIFGKFLLIVLCSSLVASAIVWLLIAVFFNTEVAIWLRAIIWVVCFSGISRTCINYFQGVGQPQKMAVINSLLSVVSIISVIAGAISWSLNGWIYGRYIGEFLFLLGGVFFTRNVIGLPISIPPKYSVNAILSLSIPLMLSVIVRSFHDNLGLLVLSVANVSTNELGNYGFCSLFLLAVLIVPGAISNLAIPNLTKIVNHTEQFRSLLSKSLLFAFISTAMLALVTLMTLAVLTPAVFPRYGATLPLLSLLLLMAPLRGVSSVLGAALIALDQNLFAFIINGIMLLIALAVVAVTGKIFGMHSNLIAIIQIVIEFLSLITNTLWLRRILHNHKSTGANFNS
jgi:O-antigen/teichoic acid export membrane protein